MTGRMFSLACLCGLITAVTHVHGWWWTGIRIAVFVLFVVDGARLAGGGA
jgi:hypothetical protein